MKKLLMFTMSFLLIFFVCSGCSNTTTDSSFDRATISERVNNAQYIPNANYVFGNDEINIDNVSKNNNLLYSKANILKLSEMEATDSVLTSFDIFSFEKLLCSLATINSTASGKYLGYDVFEIKTEMYNMVNRAPYLNEWFRVPRPQGGIDYFSDWAFLIENNLENNFLSITRICWCTRASYYDSETGTEVEDYTGGSCVQYNVMKTNYYFEENTENVEVIMYDVMLAHDKVIPIGYQYLKNAKDSYFIKYDIKSAPRSDLGYLIDTETKYGASREFNYMTYDKDTNFNLLKITQNLPNKYSGNFNRIPSAQTSLDFIRQNAGVQKQYNVLYSYSGDNVQNPSFKCSDSSFEEPMSAIFSTTSEMAERLGIKQSLIDNFFTNSASPAENNESLQKIDSFLFEVSKEEIDNHYIANNWDKIFKDSNNAKVKIESEIELPLKLKYHYCDTTINNIDINISSKAYLMPNPTFRNMKECDYYLAPAFLDENGKIYSITDSSVGATNDYDSSFDIMWYGVWLDLSLNVSANSVFNITEKGDYVLIIAMKKEGSKETYGNYFLTDVQCNDCQITLEENGFFYKLYDNNGLLMLTVY